MINFLKTLRQPRQFQALLWWSFTLAWAALIFYLSTERFGSSFSGWLLRDILAFTGIYVSPRTFVALHFCLRKLAHVTEYAIFSSLLYGCLQNNRPMAWRARTALWCVLIAGAYSLSDELHQFFVPGRTAALIDCGIDTVGASMGMLFVYGNDRVFARRSKGLAEANENIVEE